MAQLFRTGTTSELLSERHMEVLRVALLLIAERGYAGASLRELARRLGVQQPSLYHYFETKEQLVEQIIVHLGADLLSASPSRPPPTELEDIPEFAIEVVMEIWEGPMYAAFVQLLFVVAVEQPQLREAMYALYSRGAAIATEFLLAPFLESGEIDREDGYTLVRTGINSVALMQIEERLLYGRHKASPELLRHAKLTAAWLRDAVLARKKKKR